MRVEFISCGPPANESEVKAFRVLGNCLRSTNGNEPWFLLGNLLFSVDRHVQADEIDLVIVGPPGVRVVEIKHWTASWVQQNKPLVEQEADRVTFKARKLANTLRRDVSSLPYVDAAFLLTQEPSRVQRLAGLTERGVRFFTLKNWQELTRLTEPRVLSDADITRIARLLAPHTSVRLDTVIPRFARYVNLQLQTPREERFRRVFRASHATRRDHVLLYLFDLSATDEADAEVRARREFEALWRFQRYPWAPRILDSFQPVPAYAGEMFFFTIVDPSAPSLAERAADPEWQLIHRILFARNCIRALRELHSADGILHRNLTPHTILVRHDHSPIFTGFHLARIPGEQTIADFPAQGASHGPTIAPEIREHGLAAATPQSDIYALCASLLGLLDGDTNPTAIQAATFLKQGLAETPSERIPLVKLEQEFGTILGEEPPAPPTPPARYWTEDQIVRFRDRNFRIVSRIGSGRVGSAFKVVELDSTTNTELGTYVAKVVHTAEIGNRVLESYRRIRPHVQRQKGLSSILEVASEWGDNEFLALLSWVSGSPLSDFVGVFPLLAEEAERSPNDQALALRWLRQACQALAVLHEAGFVHGDVSPKNLIVSGRDIVLIDYDFATPIGGRIPQPGTPPYCSASFWNNRPASAADDFYALAASFYHVVFSRLPKPAEQNVGAPCFEWLDEDRQHYPQLVAFIETAMHPDPKNRFLSATDALAALSDLEPTKPHKSLPPALPSPPVGRKPQRVEWLRSLLQSYPGSRWGNQETRGLDTEFAASTYVQTRLEQSLLEAIRRQRARLVILCGNAGDGKTALLQHLARELGLGEHLSAQRIIDGALPNGPRVRINLDGSAAHQGRSADEILDEFFAPFQHGPPTDNVVHLLAINDGRLLEWLDGFVQRNNGRDTPLTATLYGLLEESGPPAEPYLRFIDLNQRSLVGEIRETTGTIQATFLHQLLDSLYGGARAAEIWEPCRGCSANDYCSVYAAARLFGPDGIPTSATPETRSRARERLFEALQAVHLRGDVHVTARELRAALVFILFGVHFCDDYHGEGAFDCLPYWDRAFSPKAPGRQGEVLAELVRFDPGLEAHPKIDRYLQGTAPSDGGNWPPSYPDLPLDSARRRAFFEWTEEQVRMVAGEADALELARARHLRRFREIPLASETERAQLCAELCRGIARLEDLPPAALARPDVVPLRVTPRTPTETCFWVEKPLAAFRLEPDLPPPQDGIDRLHRQIHLVYRYRNGEEEILPIGADLFHVLLELAEGYQLGDTSSDDTFAHLSIFVQRLVREEEREMLAWNPAAEEVVFRVHAVMPDPAKAPAQRIVIEPVGAEELP